MMKKLFLFALIVLLSVSIFSVTNHLTILHVNDTHGHAWEYSVYGNPDIGGFAAVSTIVDQVRNEVESCGGEVLVLHAGDYNTGVPESDQLDAAPDIVAMNMIGFDAVVLGNHEFDKSRDVLLKQMDLIDFPVISANILNEKDEHAVEPYTLFDFEDYTVAVYGLTTEETRKLEPIYLDNWHFEDAIETSEKLLPELEEKADVIVSLAHLGYKSESNNVKTDSDELAAAFDNIDVIVDGHTHNYFEEAPYINDTLIVQAVDWNKYVGRIDLTIVDGEVVDYEWQLIPVNLKESGDAESYVGEPVEQDPKVLAAMDYFAKLGDEKLNEVLGKTEIYLNGERSDVRSKATNLANLITDAMIWKTDADLALQNGGGIRASIEAGDISYRDILTVLPFGNTVYVLNLSGAEIMNLLEYAVSVSPGEGAYPQFAGVRFFYENGEIKDVTIDGEPLESDKTYRLVTNNYLASGGDGYDILAEKGDAGYDTGFVLADVVKDYIKDLGVITEYPGEPRYVRK